MQVLETIGKLNGTLSGLATIATNQPSLVKLMLKNWPIALLAGAALAGQYRRRWKAGELTFFQGMADTGMILGPLVSVLLIQKLAREQEESDQRVEQFISTYHPPAHEQPTQPESPAIAAQVA